MGEVLMDGGELRVLADRAAAPLKVFLLGRFEVVRGDAPIPHSAWRRRRPADLLKLISLSRTRVLSREDVIATLWPDKDPASGANNLHRALYDLRQILAGRWVELEHGQVSMRAEVWVDVDAFEASASGGEGPALESAVALYRGDLSPEDRDSPWLTSRRLALRRAFASAALPVARAAAERGESSHAIALLRRVLDADPASEPAYLLIVRLLAQSGRRADALRHVDACESALRARGAGPPSPELRALRDSVQRGELGPPHLRLAYDGYRRTARRLLGTADPPPLRGRTSALLLFESMIEEGSGSIVLLGERGVGKSRLAVEGARIAQEGGALVLTGVFDPMRPSPYGAFADLFADYARTAGNGGDPFAERPSGAAAPELEKARILEAVRASLAAISGGRPLYLLLDDLHRADESSANLFHYLARSARALRLMLVGTCREDQIQSGSPVQMLLAHLDCERLARGVRVQRLNLEGSKQQLTDILGAAPSEALATQFYRITDGSPFYTEELARAFKDSGHVKVPTDPAAAVRERAARLGPRAVALLEAASVAGRRFEFETVKPASALTGHDALAALDAALEARILDEDGAGYHFHHSLGRDAIYGALAPPRRAELHRAIADAIEARAALAPGAIEDAAELLAHHRRAGDQPERAFGHLVAAGHRAAARAGLREASGFYEAALALADAASASGTRRLELLEALGNVQLALAELPGALRTFDAAMALADVGGWRPGPEPRARARRGAALALLATGRRAEAAAQVEAAVADALSGGGDERAEAYLLSAQLAWHDGRSRDAAEAAIQAMDEAQRLGDAPLAARARDLSLLAGGPAAPANGSARSADEERAETGPEQPFEVHLVLWENDLLGDRAVTELEAGVVAYHDRAVARQAPTSIATARAVEGALATRAGRLDVAEPLLREAAEVAGRAGSALVEAFAVERLGALLTVRGRVDEALSLLGAGVLVAERANLRRHALTRLHAALAANRIAAGALYAAEDALREASELAPRHGECAVCHALFRPELVRVALLRGRVDDAEAAATELEVLAAQRGGRGLWAVARQARARVLLAHGRTADAAAALVEAAGLHEALGARLDAALAWALAARAGAADASDEARAAAQELAARAATVLGPLGIEHVD